MNNQDTRHTEEQQFHPGTSGAEESSMTRTSAESVEFARRNDSNESYVEWILCEASMLPREENSAGTTPTERVTTNTISHSLVIDD